MVNAFTFVNRRRLGWPNGLQGEVCVCDFVGPVGKAQPTISHHLRILGEAGLVHGDRRGKWVWYSLDRERLSHLRAALDA